MIGFLHPQRVEVLHALALLAGGREALPEGLERLAAEDPLLRPWAERLVPRLRAGEPLAECLRRTRLLSRQEAEAFVGGDLAQALSHVISRITHSSWRLVVVRWLPTLLTAVAALSFNAALWVMDEQFRIAEELGINWPDPLRYATGAILVVLFVALIQQVLGSLRAVRHVQHLWCPAIHRAAAWQEFAQAVHLHGELVVAGGWGVRQWRRTRLSACRRGHPTWDLPWRTWLFLTRFRLGRAQRRQLRSLPTGAERLGGLGDQPGQTACAAAQRQLDDALSAAWPMITVTFWVVALGSFLLGLIRSSWLFSSVENLGQAAGHADLNSAHLVQLLIVAGIGLGLIIALQSLIAVVRFFTPVVPDQVAAAIGTAVARALRGHHEPHLALAALAGRLPWPFSWRVRAAASRLAANGSCDLAATLVGSGVLPKELLSSGAAAERLGVRALAEWADTLAGRIDVPRLLLSALMPFLAIGLLMLVHIAFIAVVIEPKFSQIFKELGITQDPPLSWMERLPPWWAIVATLGALLAGAWATLIVWRWRVMRRRFAAQVVLSGVAIGASEAELARSLGLAPAAAANGFGALLAAIGWLGISQPVELAEALDAVEERDRRWLSWLRSGMQLVLPLLLAIPVWLLASGIFGSLIRILNTVAAQEG